MRDRVITIIRAIWSYRYFILGLVKKDFKLKYLNSVLGSIWAIINPLAFIFIYTIIFSQVMQAKLPGVTSVIGYSIYLCAGQLTWQLFTETLQRTQNVFLDQSNLLKKVSFPRSTLPVFVVISSIINFMIIFGIFLIFLFSFQMGPGIKIISLIPLLVLQEILAVGLGLLFGSLNIFFRDVSYIVGIVLQFWFWLTPIVYSIQIVPDKYKYLFNLNMIIPLIKGYQVVLLNHEWPAWHELLPLLCISLVSLAIGYLVFKKLDKEMVDEL